MKWIIWSIYTSTSDEKATCDHSMHKCIALKIIRRCYPFYSQDHEDIGNLWSKTDREQWGESKSGLESAFNHSWSHHRPQVGLVGVCRCMRGDLMSACLFWAERSTPNNFWVPGHRFNSATGEQEGITQMIYTDSDPPSRMPNSLCQAPSWEAQTSYF